MYKVHLKSGLEQCYTGNHPVLTQRGWTIARELTIFDQIITAKGISVGIVDVAFDKRP